ncbi:hypothetical protein L7F22_052340 [Adiantum nelumboides]|nr:hypothetical protein [Adiantum nelumboides]
MELNFHCFTLDGLAYDSPGFWPSFHTAVHTRATARPRTHRRRRRCRSFSPISRSAISPVTHTHAQSPTHPHTHKLTQATRIDLLHLLLKTEALALTLSPAPFIPSQRSFSRTAAERPSPTSSERHQLSAPSQRPSPASTPKITQARAKERTEREFSIGWDC